MRVLSDINSEWKAKAGNLLMLILEHKGNHSVLIMV